MKTKTTIVCWPSSQILMEQNGFRENAALCNSDRMYDTFGDSSYAISEKWLNSLPKDVLGELSKQEMFNGPRVDFEAIYQDGMLMMI